MSSNAFPKKADCFKKGGKWNFLYSASYYCKQVRFYTVYNRVEGSSSIIRAGDKVGFMSFAKIYDSNEGKFEEE